MLLKYIVKILYGANYFIVTVNMKSNGCVMDHTSITQPLDPHGEWMEDQWIPNMQHQHLDR